MKVGRRGFVYGIILLVVFSVFVRGDDYDEEDEEGGIVQNVKERKLVTPTPTTRSILKEHSVTGTETYRRHFTGPTLGYVTPCAGGKLVLTGEHDVDKKWMNDLQNAKNCPHRLQRDDTGHHFPGTLVVPRFHVEGWTLEAYQALFTPGSPTFKKFVDLVALSLQSHHLDGFVLDAGYLNFRAPWRDGMIALFKALGEATKVQSKLFILVVPPLRNNQPEENMFNAQDFTALVDHVDYFSMMTYDFSSSANPGPSSPMDWFLLSQASLLTPQQQAEALGRKILGGVNLYGNDFFDGQGGPVIASDILSLLKSKKPKITWDKQAQEHFFEYNDKSTKHKVWFPTLNYIQQRIDTASTKTQTGLSFWELGQGMDYFYDLL